MNNRNKNYVLVAVGVAITVTFAYLAFRGIDFLELKKIILSVSISTLVFAFLLLLGANVIRIVRWWMMVRILDGNVSFRACVAPYLISLSLCDFIPLRIGELVRTFACKDAIDVPPVKRAGTIVIERLLDSVVLFLFFFVGLLWVDRGVVPQVFIDSAVDCAIVLILILLMMMFFARQVKALISSILKFDRLKRINWLQRIGGWVNQFFDSLDMAGSPFLLFQLFSLSILLWSMEGLMCVAIAREIDPAIGLMGPFFSLATGALSTVFPATPGMIGILDYFLMLGVMAYGMNRVAAASFAVLVHIYFLSFSFITVTYYIFNSEGKNIVRNIVCLWKQRRATIKESANP